MHANVGDNIANQLQSLPVPPHALLAGAWDINLEIVVAAGSTTTVAAPWADTLTGIVTHILPIPFWQVDRPSCTL